MSIFSGIRNSVEGAIPVIGPILQGQRQAGAQQDLANQVNSQMNPLFQGQRQGYQNQLSNLMTPQGASSFLQNDPFVKSGTEFLQNQGTANFAKSGNLPLSALNQNAAITQLMSGEYNNRIGQLSTLGGFNQPVPGYLPQTMGNIGQQGINSLFGGQALGGGQALNMLFGSGNPFSGMFGGMGGGGGPTSLGLGAGMGMDSIANAGEFGLAAF